VSGSLGLAQRSRCPGVNARIPILVLTLLALTASSAFAGTADIHDGVGVFAGGNARFAYAAPGQPLTVWIRGDRLFGPTTNPSTDGIRAIQFGVQVDPRLMVIQKSFADPNTLKFEVAPNEWILGMDCLGIYDGYPPIMSYTILVPPGATDISDMRVTVGDLVEYGEPMAWTTCWGGKIRRDVFGAGGMIINPSPGAIVHLSAAPRVVVEGRPYRVAWETVGSDVVTLDGLGVDSLGGIDLIATEDHNYLLSSVAGGVEVTEQVDVDVIREPRIVSFTAERVLSHDVYRVHLSWVVEGSGVVSIDGAPGNYVRLGDANLLDKDPSVWILRASNEWGNAAAIASPDPLASGPPHILDFSSPNEAWTPLEPVQLNWSIYGADTARIEPGIGAIDPGSSGMEITLTEDTQLELIATNQNGESRATLDFQLLETEILKFELKTEPFGGFPVTLAWETRYAETLNISPLPGDVSGSSGSVEIVMPGGPTNFVLTASNAISTATSSIYVWALPPRLQFLRPQGPVIAGVPFTFEILTLDGALSANVEPEIGAIAPEAQLVEATIAEETTFVITATNAAGTTTQRMGISIDGYGVDLPTVAITVDQASPPLGTPVQLSYLIENAQSASIEPGIGVVAAKPGSIELTPLEETTYVLTATNPNGTSTAQVMVAPGSPAIISFAADDNPLPYGQTTTALRWEFIGASSSAIAALGITDLDPTGSVEINPTADTDYELVVANAQGESRATVSLVLDTAPARIVSFGASPSIVRSGDPVYLRWETSGIFDSVEIVGIGVQAAQGQLVVHPTQTTTYTLRVNLQGGVLEESAAVTVDDSLQPDLVLSWGDSDPQAEAPVLLPFQPFTLWALAVDMADGVTGATFRLELPECLSLLGQSFPSGGLNLGTAPDVILGLGQCVTGPVVALTEYSLMINQAGGCPSGTELSFGPPSVGSDAAERSNCGNVAIPFRLDLPMLLYEGSGGEARPLEVNLDGKKTPEGVELNWRLPGETLPASLCLHRHSSAGDERLEEWVSKDLSKDGSYLDTTAPEGEPIEYWLEANYPGVTVNSERVQMELELSYIPPREPIFTGASPNPFNPTTSIEFELDRVRHVSLRIYDMSGRRIWEHAESFPAGLQSVPWTGVDHTGRRVASGSYFVQLEYEDGSLSSRLTLVR
jgi:hypothetical protein